MNRTSASGRPYCVTISASSLSSFASVGFVAGELQRPFEVVDDGPEGAVDVVGRALEAQRLHALHFEPLAQRAQDAALADPGFTRQQHHLAFAIPCLRPPAKQQIKFLVAAHQRRQRLTAATGVEAALRHQGTLHPPGVNRFGDAFQVVFAQIGQFKRVADQATGRGGDDNLVGGGQSLQTRGQIGRAAHRQLRLVPRTGRFANDDRAGGDADTDRQVLGGGGPLDGMNDLQGRPHGALGVVFVCGGPAEIGQDAIAHVAGDKPVVARDHIAAEGSIRVQQAAQLFGVELFTQRRRTHQVAEHHGELAALAC